MKTRTRLGAWIGALALLAASATPAQALNTCTNDGYWDVDANWDAGHAPLAGEDALVPVGRSVTITNSTAYMASFTNAGTLTFDAWDAALQATNMTLGGTVTHAFVPATNDPKGTWTVRATNLVTGQSTETGITPAR